MAFPAIWEAFRAEIFLRFAQTHGVADVLLPLEMFAPPGFFSADAHVYKLQGNSPT